MQIGNKEETKNVSKFEISPKRKKKTSYGLKTIEKKINNIAISPDFQKTKKANKRSKSEIKIKISSFPNEKPNSARSDKNEFSNQSLQKCKSCRSCYSHKSPNHSPHKDEDIAKVKELYFQPLEFFEPNFSPKTLKRFILKNTNGKVVVRVGGGYMEVEDFYNEQLGKLYKHTISRSLSSNKKKKAFAI